MFVLTQILPILPIPCVERDVVTLTEGGVEFTVVNFGVADTAPSTCLGDKNLA
jgi:hypothetical protein